jgi:tetratricopeptide (TPR) repeat protein
MSFEKQNTVRALEAKIAGNPGSLSFVRLADSHRKRGDIGQAMTVCAEGLRQHPHNVTGRLILGRCYLEQEKLQEALKEFIEVCKLDRRNLLAVKMMADIYAKQGMDDKAGGLQAYLFRLDPENRSLSRPDASAALRSAKPLFDILGIKPAGVAPSPGEAPSGAVIESPGQQAEVFEQVEPLGPVTDADLDAIGIKTQQGSTAGVNAGADADTLLAEAEAAVAADMAGSPADAPAAEKPAPQTPPALDKTVTGDDVSNRMSAIFDEAGESGAAEKAETPGPAEMVEEPPALETAVAADATVFEETQVDTLRMEAPSPAPEQTAPIQEPEARQTPADETLKTAAMAAPAVAGPAAPDDDLESGATMAVPAADVAQAAATPAGDDIALRVQDLFADEAAAPEPESAAGKAAPKTQQSGYDISAAETTIDKQMSGMKPVEHLDSELSGDDISQRIQELFQEEEESDAGPQPAYGLVDILDQPAPAEEAALQPFDDVDQYALTQAISRSSIMPEQATDEPVDTVASEPPVPSPQTAPTMELDRSDLSGTRKVRPPDDTAALPLKGDITEAIQPAGDDIDAFSAQTIAMDRSAVLGARPPAPEDMGGVDSIISDETTSMPIPTGDDVVDHLTAVLDRGELRVAMDQADVAGAIPEEDDTPQGEAGAGFYTVTGEEVGTQTTATEADDAESGEPDTRHIPVLEPAPVEEKPRAGRSAIDTLAIADKLDEMFPDDSLTVETIAADVPDDGETSSEGPGAGFYTVTGEEAAVQPSRPEPRDTLGDTNAFAAPSGAVMLDETGSIPADGPVREETAPMSFSPPSATAGIDEVVIDENVATPDGDAVASRISELFPDDLMAEETPSAIPDDADAGEGAVGAGFYTVTGEDAQTVKTDSALLDTLEPVRTPPAVSFAPHAASPAADIESPEAGEALADDGLSGKAGDQTDADAIPDHVITPTLADIYYQQGQPRLALQIYRRILDRDPDNPRIVSRIAEIENAIENGEAPLPAQQQAPASEPKASATQKIPAASRAAADVRPRTRKNAPAKPLKGIKLTKTQRDKLRKRRPGE